MKSAAKVDQDLFDTKDPNYE